MFLAYHVHAYWARRFDAQQRAENSGCSSLPVCLPLYASAHACACACVCVCVCVLKCSVFLVLLLSVLHCTCCLPPYLSLSRSPSLFLSPSRPPSVSVSVSILSLHSRLPPLLHSGAVRARRTINPPPPPPAFLGGFRPVVHGLGTMSIFALNRFVAEAFGHGAGVFDHRPLSGIAPRNSLFLCDRGRQAKRIALRVHTRCASTLYTQH